MAEVEILSAFCPTEYLLGCDNLLSITLSMQNDDILLVYPPAVYDFRSKPLFPGALGRTAEGVQFIKAPMGMLSIAEYHPRWKHLGLLGH